MYNVIKRILDIIFSFLLIIITIVPMILIMILVLILDRINPIYIQNRTGLYGKEFKLIKIRTIKNNEITEIGNILRKTSIDEIPQLINIIKGDMSFIGPRPWIPDYYNNMNKKQRKRYNVLPGLTGLAQISGRNNIEILEKIKLDLYYVNNYNFILDLRILLKTIYVIFKYKDNGNGKGIENEINVLKRYGSDVYEY